MWWEYILKVSEGTQGTKHLGERLWLSPLRREGESSAIYTELSEELT